MNLNIINTMKTLIPQSSFVHTDGNLSKIGNAPANPDAAPDNTGTSTLAYETRFKILGVNAVAQSGAENEAVNLTLSEVFDKCAQLLQQEIIKDFTLTRTTMGEVFTDFAKF